MRFSVRSCLVVAAVLVIGRSGAGQTPPVALAYQVKTPGAMSLGIYDPQGRLLRTLQSGKKIKTAGAYSVAWDGKDDAGNALPAGQYRYQGLSANVGWKYQLAMGNSGQPPYLTADGSGGMGGVWGNIVAAATDSTGKYVYLLWAMEEGTPSLCKFNPHGGEGSFKVWGAHDNWSWGPCQALACDGQYVYVGNSTLCAQGREPLRWEAKD